MVARGGPGDSVQEIVAGGSWRAGGGVAAARCGDLPDCEEDLDAELGVVQRRHLFFVFGGVLLGD